MSNSTISAIVIAVEFVLRAVCVYAILRVTLTLFSIRKAEKLEKELARTRAELDSVYASKRWKLGSRLASIIGR